MLAQEWTYPHRQRAVLAYGHRGQSTGQRGSISFELKV